MSWHQDDFTRSIPDQTVITITWAVADQSQPQAVRMTSAVTSAEAYTTTGEILDVEMVNDSKNSPGEFALYQNEPNPWQDETMISFVLPEEAIARFTFYDITGKVVKSIEGRYIAGTNTIRITKNEMPVTGVVYYRLESNGYSASKKMVLIP